MRTDNAIVSWALLFALVLTPCVWGQEVEVTRSIASPNYGLEDPVSVTLTAPAFEMDVTVVETIPDNFTVADPGEGSPAGKNITFTVPAAEGDIPPQLISAVRGGTSTNTAPVIVENGLVEGALAMVDRTHVYVEVTGTIVDGASYVRVANDDKTVADYSLTVEADKDTLLYLLIDDRVGDDSNANPPDLSQAMTWVVDMGFQDTGQKISIDENNDGSINQYYTIYSLPVVANDPVELLEQNNTGGRNMYGVAIPPGVPPVTFNTASAIT